MEYPYNAVKKLNITEESLIIYFCECMLFKPSIIEELSFIYKESPKKFDLNSSNSQLIDYPYFKSSSKELDNAKLKILGVLIECSKDDETNNRVANIMKQNYMYSYLYVANSNPIYTNKFIKMLKKRYYPDGKVPSAVFEAYNHFIAMIYFTNAMRRQVIDNEVNDSLFAYLNNLYTENYLKDKKESTVGEKKVLTFLKEQISLRIGDITDIDTYLNNPKQNKSIMQNIEAFKDYGLDVPDLFTKFMPDENEQATHLLKYVRAETKEDVNINKEHIKHVSIDMDIAIAYHVSGIFTSVILKAFNKINSV